MNNDLTTYLTFCFFIHNYFVNSIIKNQIPFLFEKKTVVTAVCTETAEIHNLFNT